MQSDDKVSSSQDTNIEGTVHKYSPHAGPARSYGYTTESPSKPPMEATTPTKRLIKLTVNVSSEAYNALKEMAATRGVTVTEALRQAISTAKWVQETTAQGEKILKQDRQGHLFEVVFR